MRVNRRWNWMVLLLLPLLAGVSGCDKHGSGQVQFVMNWPAAAVAPSANSDQMRSIHVQVYNDQRLVMTRIVSRPDENEQSECRFDKVSVGTYRFFVTAYSDANGIGKVMAEAGGAVKVLEDQTVSVTLTTVSDPAATLSIKPSSATVGVGSRIRFFPVITNPDRSLAFVPPGTFSWRSDDRRVATINPNNGEATAVGDGTVRIEVTDTRAGRTAHASLYVQASRETPSVQITAVPMLVRAGEPVTISWRVGHDVHLVRSTNFVAAGSFGSTLDFPRRTTVYSITVSGTEGEITERVIVTVY